MPKFVCLSPDDQFTTDSHAEAMTHIATYPGHKIAEVDSDPYTGETDTKTINIEVKEES